MEVTKQPEAERSSEDMVAKKEAESKKIFQWGEEYVDIATLETKIYAAVLDLGRDMMRQCVEQADRQLAQQRDRSMYRDKGYRRTTIKTVMGEVEYRRHVYTLSEQDDTPTKTIYLLDESMGLDTVGFFSDTVCMMAVETACEMSYRATAATLNDLTGLNISHESVWRIVQNAGTWEQTRVESLAQAAKRESGAGTYETAVLYEEMDGVYLSLQGKDRQEQGSGKEMKVSIAYSGVTEDAGGRRSLANKVSFASFEQAKEFRSHAEGVVADFYAVDCVKRRVFNSDGGLWLQKDMVPGCTYQLDPFHRNKAVRTYMSDKELQKLILSLLHDKRTTDALNVIETSIESTDDPAEQEKRRKLFRYFSNNKHALIPYYERKGGKCPEPNEGQKIAHCGSMESNIFTIIGKRMKHNRSSWSVKGANNLAALLALHHTGRLRTVLRGWEAHEEQGCVIVTGPLSAKQACKRGTEEYTLAHTISAESLTSTARYCLELLPISEMNIW